MPLRNPYLGLGRRTLARGLGAWLGATALGACKRQSSQRARLQLNWLPEPEFGGFYEAKRQGRLAKVELLAGSPGLPTASLLASHKIEYGVLSADELVRMVAQSAPIVAIFACCQRSPRALVVHQDSPYQSLQALWQSEATVGIEPGQGYVRWLDHRFGGQKLKRVPRPASLATFMQDPSMAQGVYLFAEGAQLQTQGASVRMLPVADSGYNPYEVVVATTREHLKAHPQEVRRLVQELEFGWGAYLDEPGPSNEIMAKLNPAMSKAQMDAAAKLLTPLVRLPGQRLGRMQAQRWQTLIDQMVATQGLASAPAGQDCFVSTIS